MSEKQKNSVLLVLLLATIAGCIFLYRQVQELSLKVDRMAAQIADIKWSERIMAQLNRPTANPQEVEEPVEAATEDSVKHKVYLTFDDGPSIYTDEILDILAEYNVKATFFVVGKEDEHSQAAIQRIVEEGHTLGMHSYSHKYTELYDSLDSFIEDFDKEQGWLKELTGEECKFYRFPGGSSNTVSSQDMRLFAYYLDSRDIMFVDWNVDSGDANSHRSSVDSIIQNATADIGRWQNAVVLMHDAVDKHTTVEALPQIIEKIQAMEDTVILPITEDTVPVQHLHR